MITDQRATGMLHEFVSRGKRQSRTLFTRLFSLRKVNSMVDTALPRWMSHLWLVVSTKRYDKKIPYLLSSHRRHDVEERQFQIEQIRERILALEAENCNLAEKSRPEQSDKISQTEAEEIANSESRMREHYVNRLKDLAASHQHISGRANYYKQEVGSSYFHRADESHRSACSSAHSGVTSSAN